MARRRPIPPRGSTVPLGNRLIPSPRLGRAVLSPPTVATVGVNGITATTASLIGSVNPNGVDTKWWFTYGTTTQMGTLTVSTTAGFGTTPITVTVTITGLSTGTPYYFEAVGSSKGGTVYGAQYSFVPAAPQQVASRPVTPFGQPSVTVPHFQVPVQIEGLLGLAVVEQGTEEEVLSCVNAIVDCQIGACPELPEFGRPDPLFDQGPPDTASFVNAIRQWEPRATEQAVAQLLPDGSSWGITLTTTATTTAN